MIVCFRMRILHLGRQSLYWNGNLGLETHHFAIRLCYSGSFDAVIQLLRRFTSNWMCMIIVYWLYMFDIVSIYFKSATGCIFMSYRKKSFWVTIPDNWNMLIISVIQISIFWFWQSTLFDLLWLKRMTNQYESKLIFIFHDSWKSKLIDNRIYCC